MYRPAANIVDEETGWQMLAAPDAGHLVTGEAGSLDATFPVVHAYGVLRVHDDTEWLRDLVDDLRIAMSEPAVP